MFVEEKQDDWSILLGEKLKTKGSHMFCNVRNRGVKVFGCNAVCWCKVRYCQEMKIMHLPFPNEKIRSGIQEKL